MWGGVVPVGVGALSWGPTWLDGAGVGLGRLVHGLLGLVAEPGARRAAARLPVERVPAYRWHGIIAPQLC